jgi:hypothetical protein
MVGNKLVDEWAQQQAELEGSIFDRPLSSSDFQSLARPALMRGWQAKRDSADIGWFALSCSPKEEEKVCMHCVKGFIWTLLCSFASW